MFLLATKIVSYKPSAVMVNYISATGKKITVTKNYDEQNNTLVIYNLPRTHVIRKERLRGQQQ